MEGVASFYARISVPMWMRRQRPHDHQEGPGVKLVRNNLNREYKLSGLSCSENRVCK